MAIARRLRLDDALSPAVRWAAILYLTHLVFQGKTAVSEVAAGLTVVLVGYAVLHREVAPSFHLLYFPLFLYGIASTTSALLATRRLHLFGESQLWVKMLIFPAALILFRQIASLRELALYAHGVFVSWIAADGLLQFYRLGPLRSSLEHRITGTSTHVMTYSGLLMPLSLLFVVLWLHERRPWMLVPASLSTLALLLTLTRSAWLAWMAAVFVIIFAARPRLLVYAVPLLLLFVTFMPMAMFGRLVSSFDTRQESNLDRIRMVQAGVEIIRDYPLFGVGPANIKEIYPLYRKPDAPRFRIPHLHNNIVQIWAERGVLALAGYVLLLVLFVRECARGWSGPSARWAQAGLAVAVAMTVAGMFEFNFGDTEVFYLLLDVMALVVANIEAPLCATPSLRLSPANERQVPYVAPDRSVTFQP